MEQKERYEWLLKHIDQLQKKIFKSPNKDVNLILELEQAQNELKSLNKSRKNRTINN